MASLNEDASASHGTPVRYKHTLTAWMSAIIVFIAVWMAMSSVAAVLLGVIVASLLGVLGLAGDTTMILLLSLCHLIGAGFAFIVARKTWLTAAKVTVPKEDVSR